MFQSNDVTRIIELVTKLCRDEKMAGKGFFSVQNRLRDRTPGRYQARQIGEKYAKSGPGAFHNGRINNGSHSYFLCDA